MVKQYIGARYVPKFDGAWDNTKVYEPLTIVTYNDSSYTSKKVVPTGIDILNEEYWALTGILSGAIRNLQEQVNILDTRVEGIENHIDDIYVLIGDSYLEGFNGSFDPETFIDSYGDYLRMYLNKTEDIDFFIEAEGASGFCAQGHAGHTWIDLLNSVFARIPAEYRDKHIKLIVCGGCNDISYTIEQLKSAIESFVYRANELFDDIEILIGCIGTYRKGTEVNNQYNLERKVLRAYADCDNLKNVRYLTNAETILHRNSLMQADLYHPNADGHKTLAKGLLNILEKYGYNVDDSASIQFTNVAGTTGSFGVWDVVGKGKMGYVGLWGEYMSATFGSAVPDLDLDAGVVIGKYSCDMLCGYTDRPIRIPARLNVVNAGGTQAKEGYIELIGGDVRIRASLEHVANATAVYIITYDKFKAIDTKAH